MQQKVLIVGPDFYGYNQSVERAFIKLGYQTRVMAFLDKDAEGLKEKIAYHLSKDKVLFFDKKRRRFGEQFRKVYNAYSPDILFIIKGSIFLPETLAIADKSINILWMMDSIFKNSYSYNIRHLVQHIFLFEETDADRLAKEENIKAHFLPLALDETVYYPVNNKKEIDLLFVGALYPNRIALLNRVIHNFPGKTIKIYGAYFSPIREPLRYFFRKDKQVYTNKTVTPAQLNQLYSKAKVCLNIHHEQSVVGVNQRFFEILGASALEITDYKPFMGSHFTNGEVIWYKTENELVEKIRDAFANEADFRSVTEAGYKKVTAQHTFTARIQQVLSIIHH
jgi:spore maturation protein CgeB